MTAMLKYRKNMTAKLSAIMACVLVLSIHVVHPLLHGLHGHTDNSSEVLQIHQADHAAMPGICQDGPLCPICAGLQTLDYVVAPGVTFAPCPVSFNISSCGSFASRQIWKSILPRAPPIFS